MRYTIQQKFVSIGDDFYIKNEHGEDAYFVDGYGFSIGKRFSFQTASKEEIYDVKQRLLAFSPTFKIYKNKIHIATVRKAIGAFRDVFYLTITESKKKIKIAGKLIEHNYKFTLNGETLAQVNKKWFRNTDTYGIEIVKDFHPTLLLAAFIVVDLVCHEKESKHNRG